jgi:hypothetical protein
MAILADGVPIRDVLDLHPLVTTQHRAQRAALYGIFKINVDSSRSVQSGFFLRKKPLEVRAFGLQ